MEESKTEKKDIRTYEEHIEGKKKERYILGGRKNS